VPPIVIIIGESNNHCNSDCQNKCLFIVISELRYVTKIKSPHKTVT